MKLLCPLEEGYDRSTFDCGEAELNDYLKRFARQSQEREGARSYVLLYGNRIIAYYTLVVGAVDWQDCPEVTRKVLGKYPVPVLVIAHLAVDKDFQNRGYAAALLKDAFLRALQVCDIAGVAAVIIDAKSKEGREYCLRRQLGLKPMPGDPLRLYIPLAVIRQNQKRNRGRPAKQNRLQVEGVGKFKLQ